jgi:hypothetical protein
MIPSSAERPFIICLTPVKNEAWILDRFLQCTSLWADLIIVADQMSTDGSREIMSRYPKVQMIENKSEAFNEPERQKLLLDAARKVSIDRKKLIFALDADEILTANAFESAEWIKLLNAPKGTIVRFDFLNIHPDWKRYWVGGRAFPWAFMDDDLGQHAGNMIHSYRLPLSPDRTEITCQTIKVLHYQFTDWRRMQSKHRWYQCFELLNRNHLDPLSIFRAYNHMYGIPEEDFSEIDGKWLSFYETNGIDMVSVEMDTQYRWDGEVEKYFEQNGRHYFSSLAIWDNFGEDPRSHFQKWIHYYLFKTQILYLEKNLSGKIIRQFDKILKFLL